MYIVYNYTAYNEKDAAFGDPSTIRIFLALGAVYTVPLMYYVCRGPKHVDTVS